MVWKQEKRKKGCDDMGMEIYKILGIQRYNSNLFKDIEMNLVLKNKYTGMRESIQCNTGSDLYTLAEVAVPGDTLMIGDHYGKKSYLLYTDDAVYSIRKRELVGKLCQKTKEREQDRGGR